MSDDNVIDFRSATPSARLKDLDWSDKRSRCSHPRITVWRKEPIIECSDCGAVVDPYAWLREAIQGWASATAVRKAKLANIDAEIEAKKKILRVLRGEFKDEQEKRAAERAIAILPGGRTHR